MNDATTGWLWLTLRRRLDRARATQDLGASAVEWVIITGVLLALAGAVGWAIYRMVDGEAANLDMPDLPGSGGGGGGGGANG
ncbi:hypothetical protein [Sanguibacter suaedae]|uniref:Uncharacterized protein n=1 Tax=Sanguibacter suaedae TaxID=2795737 RepID=A0A934MA77_9MICO|nr:hypothetical protein [Sanguibacter suaedae]MBI9115330.1 hypothetical protein [Sanguibacter suaedae]